MELAQELDDFSKSFNNIMSPVDGNAPVNSKYGLSLGNTSSVFGRNLGYIASLSYVRELHPMIMVM